LILLFVAGCGRQETAPLPSNLQSVTPPPVEVVGPVREITNITGDLYRARSDNHYTVFLVTSDGVILGDPLNTAFAEWLKTEIATRFNTAVEYVLYSHHHWDHASGGAVFADTAMFVGHAAMVEALAAPLPDNAAPLDDNGDGRLERAEATGGYATNFDAFDRDGDGVVTGSEINAEIYPPDTVFTDSMTITLGGSRVETIHPGPAHSADAAILFFPDERAVFAVDFINVQRFPGSLAGSTFREYADTIGAVQALAIETVLPGHGDAGQAPDLAEYATFLEDVETAVAAGLARGDTLDQILAEVRLDAYSEWLLYDARRETVIADAYAMLTATP